MGYMDLKKKKILVTGADGFIGSHLTERLVLSGHDVRAFALYNSFDSRGWIDTLEPQVIDNLEIFSGDIRDPAGVKNAMRGCDVILHLAALIAIPYSYHSPATYVDTNVTGTLNLLQAARELNIEKFIHTSTSEVYGTALYVPIDEKHPLQGQSPYSATKIGADQLALSFHHSFDTPVSVIRPFNTYGPRQSTRAVIPTIITQIAVGNRTLELGALSPTRDFNFVVDTVSGFIAMAKSDQAIGEIVNIGSNFEISIGDTAQTIAREMGVEISIKTDQSRLRPVGSEVERLWAENTKAITMLDWAPRYSGLDGFTRGIRETISWFTDKDNLSKYRSKSYTV